MRAGKLDRIIDLQRSAIIGNDGAGNPELAWTVIARLRAQIVDGSRQATIGGEKQIDSAETVTFRTRFVDGVSLADRVVYQGAVHDLVEVKEIGRRRGLELRTRRIGP